jgi:tricarboxylate carrier
LNAGARRQFACGAAAAGGVGALLWQQPPMKLDSTKTSAVPPFTMDSPKYDQSTFYGRLMGMIEYIDPRGLLLSSEEVKKAQALLEEFKKTGKIPAGLSDEAMWEARKTVEVSVHPVTGEELIKVGRMSAFVPMNVPLCALMLMASGTQQVVFAQVLNQTYNMVNNYVNRSGATDWSALLQSYALAVGASCSIAVTAGKLIQALPALQVMGPFVPYLAVIAAGSANVSFTRMEEWKGKGVGIVSEEGKDLGLSLAAGQMGVLQTVLTRSCFLPIAPMVLPIFGMKALGAVAPILTTGALGIVSEIVLICGCISTMLPCALAILPQKMEIPVSRLEPEYQNLVDSQGKPITKVFANKGL